MDFDIVDQSEKEPEPEVPPFLRLSVLALCAVLVWAVILLVIAGGIALVRAVF